MEDRNRGKANQAAAELRHRWIRLIGSIRRCEMRKGAGEPAGRARAGEEEREIKADRGILELREGGREGGREEEAVSASTNARRTKEGRSCLPLSLEKL